MLFFCRQTDLTSLGIEFLTSDSFNLIPTQRFQSSNALEVLLVLSPQRSWVRFLISCFHFFHIKLLSAENRFLLATEDVSSVLNQASKWYLKRSSANNDPIWIVFKGMVSWAFANLILNLFMKYALPSNLRPLKFYEFFACHLIFLSLGSISDCVLTYCH